MMMKRFAQVLLGLTLLLGSSAMAQTYYVYVAAESEDEVALIRFDGETAAVAETIPVGVWPAEIEGPHGLAVSPDGEHWYVSIAHGNPYGRVYKYSTATNEPIGEVELGLFPATLQQSFATGFLYVVNFNLHGDMVPSSVSIVDPETMTELDRTETGVMPHGSRVSPNGLRHYSLAMMSGMLYEMDALSFEILRTLNLDEAVAAMDETEGGHDMDNMQTMDHSAHQNMESTMSGMAHEGMDGMMAHSKMSPTWVVPHPFAPKVYVACNGADQVVEIDLDHWRVTRRFETGAGTAPYNVEVSPDGTRMAISYKKTGATGIWDLHAGTEIAVIPNTRKVTHGLSITPDSRYAFVSVEGIGAEPGTVDIFDLQELRLVASVNIGKQAGGIAFWKMTDE